MATTADQIFKDILTLPVDERASLADRIYLSLHGDSQDAIDEAWVVECERRSREMDEGKNTGDWSKTMQELKDRYCR